MNAIEFQRVELLPDFAKTGYGGVTNYKFGNQIVKHNYIPPFYVPQYLIVQSIKLQSVSVDTELNTYTYTTLIELDLSNLTGRYFQGQLLSGSSRMQVGVMYSILINDTHRSRCILKPTAEEVDIPFIYYGLIDAEGDIFIDAEGSAFIEIIN